MGLGEYHAPPAPADGMASLANVEGKITVQKASAQKVLGATTSAKRNRFHADAGLRAVLTAWGLRARQRLTSDPNSAMLMSDVYPKR